MTDVLIFGSNGQDGHYLTELCRQRGLSVAGVSRHKAEIIGDVNNRGLVRWLIRGLEPKYVFHLAANSTVSHELAVENHDAICGGTINILEAVYRHSPKTKVFLAGSAYQFVNSRRPISECDPMSYGSYYAVARNHQTMAGRYYRDLGLKVYNGFLFPHESPRRPSEFISQIIVRSAKRAAGGDKFEIDVKNITAVKEWTFAGDTVEAMWLLMQQDSVFEANIGTGIGWSICEWARVCFDLVGKEWQDFVKQPEAILPLESCVADGQWMERLGWRPKIDFKSLARMMICQKPS